MTICIFTIERRLKGTVTSERIVPATVMHHAWRNDISSIVGSSETKQPRNVA